MASLQWGDGESPDSPLELLFAGTTLSGKEGGASLLPGGGGSANLQVPQEISANTMAAEGRRGKSWSLGHRDGRSSPLLGFI